MKTGLGLAVFGVFQHQKRLIKENFFRFRLVYAVFLRILAGVTFVPVKASNLCPIDHKSILSAYTQALKLKSRVVAPGTHPCQNWVIREQEVLSMNLQKIEDEALHLPKEERAQLIQRLVLSLESPSEEELRSDWLLEARRRGEELDNGTVQAVSSEDVMRKARALIK